MNTFPPSSHDSSLSAASREPASDTTDRTQLVRRALQVNAAFSVATGSLMALIPGLVARWLGIDTTWILRLIGVGLLLFAVDLVHQSTRTRVPRIRVLTTCIADFGWVLGSVVLLVGWHDMFTGLGVMLIVGVAAFVEIVGTAQWLGLRRLRI